MNRHTNGFIRSKLKITEATEWELKGVIQLHECSFCSNRPTAVVNVGEGEYLSLQFPACQKCLDVIVKNQKRRKYGKENSLSD